MKSRTLRTLAFSLHRWIGLWVGLILVIVGLTGSILVFHNELDTWLLQSRFGQIVPQAQQVTAGQIVESVQTAYAEHPDWKIGQLQMRSHQSFYTVRLNRPDETQWEVFVNPYTAQIMGDRQRETALFARILDLHYALLAGDLGIKLVGVVAFLLCVLSVTGVLLWNGWRKLMAGFTIKWNAHPKRTHYDIHKVVGIVSVIFLSMIAFTGFCWNFYEQSSSMIYALTFTPKPPEAKSIVIPNRPPLGIDELLKRADQALPGSVTTFVTFPSTPDGGVEVYRKLPINHEDFENTVQLDQYSGKVLYVQDSRKLRLGDRILNAFVPMHYGTFGGTYTRILYILIGLSPTILFVTGIVMTIYHRKRKPLKQAQPTLPV